MNTQDFIEIEEEYGAHNYHPLDVVIERAKACGFMMWKAKNISIVFPHIRRSIRDMSTLKF